MVEQEDKIVIDAILSKDPAAFLPFVRKYEKLVAHVVGRMVSNASDREDLCQDIFIKIYSSLGSFQYKCKVSTWVARIAYNTCVNYLQKKRIPLLADLRELDEDGGDPFEHVKMDGPAPDAWVDRVDMSARLQKELDALPPQYRMILTLFHMDEMKYSEISEMMGLPEGTVKSYLFRARKHLKNRLRLAFVQEAI